MLTLGQYFPNVNVSKWNEFSSYSKCLVISAIEEFHRYQRGQASPLIEHTEYTCKLFDYIRYILYSMSSWWVPDLDKRQKKKSSHGNNLFVSRVIVALAVERLVAIKFPLWSKYICTVVNARRIIVLILLFTMLIQSYRLVIKGLDCSQLSSTNGTCRCKTLPDYAHIDLTLTIYVWRLILMTLFPLTVIITVNILIMSKLFNESSLVDHTNTSGNARQKMKLVYKISRMLVIVTSVYLLLHVPGSILEIFKFLYFSVFRNCNLKFQYYIHVTQDVFDLLTNFNYGINFYLYIVSGKHIRNELVRVFRESSWRSKSSVKNSRYRRSSYFMSSYVHVSKSPQARSSHVPLSRRPTDSSL